MENNIFQTTKKGETLIISCPDELLGGKEGTVFSQILHDNKDSKKVVVDLSNVRIINSTGVGMLVGGFTSCKKNGVEFSLAAPGESLLGILKMTHLDKVFPIHNSVESALA